jgi:hypothetical protein
MVSLRIPSYEHKPYIQLHQEPNYKKTYKYGTASNDGL